VWVYVLGVYVELLLFVEVLDQYHDDAFAGVYVRLFVYLSHNFCCFIVSNKRCIVLSVPVRPRQCAHCVAHYAELDPPQGRPRPDGRSARVSLRVHTCVEPTWVIPIKAPRVFLLGPDRLCCNDVAYSKGIAKTGHVPSVATCPAVALLSAVQVQPISVLTQYLKLREAEKARSFEGGAVGCWWRTAGSAPWVWPSVRKQHHRQHCIIARARARK
jgi:hypothetical protein